MHMVATLVVRLKSGEVEEKLTMKHSISGSSRASDMMGMDIQSVEFISEIVSDPLCIT